MCENFRLIVLRHPPPAPPYIDTDGLEWIVCIGWENLHIVYTVLYNQTMVPAICFAGTIWPTYTITVYPSITIRWVKGAGFRIYNMKIRCFAIYESIPPHSDLCEPFCKTSNLGKPYIYQRNFLFNSPIS